MVRDPSIVSPSLSGVVIGGGHNKHGTNYRGHAFTLRPGGARIPARRLISWGPPAIWPTRAHPEAHCSTEAPANTARRLCQ